MSNKNKGFTLIELLVVVLIIGILSAIAMPQYQKAVEKSRASQAFVLIRSLLNAYESFYAANSTYPDYFDQLDVEMKNWTGTTAWYSSCTDTRSNDNWSLQILSSATSKALYVGRISGKYKGAGFAIYSTTTLTGVPADEVLCLERTSSGILFAEEEGSYCKGIFKGTKIFTNDKARIYTLPK